MDNNIVNILAKAPEILDNQYLRDKELEEKLLKKKSQTLISMK